MRATILDIDDVLDTLYNHLCPLVYLSEDAYFSKLTQVMEIWRYFYGDEKNDQDIDMSQTLNSVAYASYNGRQCFEGEKAVLEEEAELAVKKFEP